MPAAPVVVPAMATVAVVMVVVEARHGVMVPVVAAPRFWTVSAAPTLRPEGDLVGCAMRRVGHDAAPADDILILPKRGDELIPEAGLRRRRAEL